MSENLEFMISTETGDPLDTVNPVELLNENEEPKPNTRTRKKPAVKKDPQPSRGPGRPSKSDVEREVANEIKAILLLVSSIWANYDPECPIVLTKQSKDISDALAAILAKHPNLLNKLRNATGFGDYFALALAIAPVAKAIGQHHMGDGMKKRNANGEAA